MAQLERIELAVGADYRVRLPSLSGAGYEWSATVEDGRRVVSVSELDAVRGGAPGESYDHVFVLLAVARGTAHIRFVQRRAWDAETAPRDTHLLEVAVR